MCCGDAGGLSVSAVARACAASQVSMRSHARLTRSDVCESSAGSAVGPLRARGHAVSTVGVGRGRDGDTGAGRYDELTYLGVVSPCVAVDLCVSVAVPTGGTPDPTKPAAHTAHDDPDQPAASTHDGNLVLGADERSGIGWILAINSRCCRWYGASDGSSRCHHLERDLYPRIRKATSLHHLRDLGKTPSTIGVGFSMTSTN